MSAPTHAASTNNPLVFVAPFNQKKKKKKRKRDRKKKNVNDPFFFFFYLQTVMVTAGYGLSSRL